MSAFFAAVLLVLSGASAPSFTDIETAYLNGNLKLTEQHQKEFDCYAKVIWFEANGESELGKQVVANVVQNRVSFGKPFKPSVCEVVYQKSQFSWTLKPKLKQISFRKVVKKKLKTDEKQVRETVKTALLATIFPVNVTDATHFCGKKYNCGFRRVTELGVVGGHRLFRYWGNG